MSKIVTYVLRVAKTFPAYHPRKGQQTDFRDKIEAGTKIHTIRDNYDYWSKAIDKVNRGEAVLSLRQWEGKPYDSPCGPAQEFDQFFHKPEGNILGYQKAVIKHTRNELKMKVITLDIDGKRITTKVGGTLDDLAKNDGFDQTEDLLNWFNKPIKNGIIIHFTDYRY